MKKIIPILFVLFLIYGFSHKEEILIPSDAIRFRVIANSNTMSDQELKLKVKKILEEQLNPLMAKAQNSTEAKELIKQNMKQIRMKVNEIEPNNTVSFGQNYFPDKEYYGVTYPKGSYESLVVTLGSGAGNNWWCVMFPPLCLLEANENNKDTVEYKFLIEELIKKYQA